MKKCWYTMDPEAGLYRDDFSGTYVYEDTGRTLAEEFPDQHFWAPWYTGPIFAAACWIKGRAAEFVYRRRVENISEKG